ncbi:MAG: transposase [Bacteroidales bacterium]|nr:transposase [Bacteroidales bacterium]MCD8393473.1 transposase [Bacteroidales bacterium]
MANTYYTIYLHTVFAVKYREALIPVGLQEDFFRVIGGIINEKGHKPLLVGGVADHIHFLWSMSLKPKAFDIPQLVQSIKNSTNHWLNEGLRCGKKFEWQEGYGCFSVSPTQRDQLEAYILDQPNHHKNESFLDEYDRLLRLNRVVNPQYKFVPLI